MYPAGNILPKNISPNVVVENKLISLLELCDTASTSVSTPKEPTVNVLVTVKLSVLFDNDV